MLNFTKRCVHAAGLLLAGGFLAMPAQAGFISSIDTSTDLAGSFAGASNEGFVCELPSIFELLPRNYPLCYNRYLPQNIAEVGSVWPGTPDSPDFYFQIPDSLQIFSPLSGYYTNSGISQDGGTVYWRFNNLQDTGGDNGIFSGNYCFSTTEANCASGVPEPASLALLGLGLAGLAASRRRRQ